MFLSVRRFAEPMTWLRRLKVKVTLQGYVIYASVRVRSISPEPFERFSLKFTQMFLSVRQFAEPMTWLRRLKVKVTLQGYVIYPSVCVRSISPEPFSLKFTQMFLSVRRFAEFMTWLRRLKVKVTLQGYVIYPSVCVRSISPEPFSLKFTQMFLSVRRFAEPMTWLRRLRARKKFLDLLVLWGKWCKFFTRPYSS